ncbi:hypothetical protein LTR97_003450 [Elasticomyces elasticus]|uniref:Protein kinase domain-containing protein n=1 Tax=Elasticomyces elasticus TaxID=574655 RepID=A0AAN7W9Y9_9PEZI|nr:hypothetical protein LTR97_003450 [Elasticomyces elasticus]
MEVAAAGVSFFSLAFQAFQGCIAAYHFCQDVRNIGRDGDLLATRLQIEKFRLISWASRSGLDGSVPEAKLDWAVINAILRQQQDILSSGDVIKQRYRLALPEDAVLDDAGNPSDDRADATGLTRLLRALRPDLYKHDSGELKATKNGQLKKLRWAAADKAALLQIITDLGLWNTELERQLNVAEQQWLRTGIDALLRELLSRTSTLDEVTSLRALLEPLVAQSDDALLAAASFKRLRLYLQVDRREDEVKPVANKKLADSMPALLCLQTKKLILADGAREDGIVFARDDKVVVLVEWRAAPELHLKLFTVSMQKFAMLLGSVDKSFATLRCKGLLTIDMPDDKRFGLVYDLPEQHLSANTKDFEMRNLYDILGFDLFPLTERLRIAVTIAEAVQQLHTSGWLHKNIRPHNVLFLRRPPTDGLVAPTINSPDVAGLDWSGPYLLGYENVRPDNIEAAAMLTSRSPHALIDDLYRHPDKRGPAGISFRKSFDLYALGCVLVELALWQRLVDLFDILCPLDGRKWRDKIATAERERQNMELPSLIQQLDDKRFLGHLGHRVSNKYIEAVRLCLRASEDEAVTTDNSVKTHGQIVACLRSCNP